MAWATKQQKSLGFELRGRLGRPSLYGFGIYGWSQYGEDYETNGVYQMRYSDKGRVWGTPRRGHRNICFMRPCWLTYLNTITQQVQTGKFKTAVSSWQALTDSERLSYNKIANRRGTRGYNYFLSKMLKSL